MPFSDLDEQLTEKTIPLNKKIKMNVEVILPAFLPFIIDHLKHFYHIIDFSRFIQRRDLPEPHVSFFIN